LVNEVAAAFRLYMDEPDQTFVNDAQLAIWLERGYDDFRAIVTEMDPHIYSRSQTYSLSRRQAAGPRRRRHAHPWVGRDQPAVPVGEHLSDRERWRCRTTSSRTLQAVSVSAEHLRLQGKLHAARD
jgi:hypothetical protein